MLKYFKPLVSSYYKQAYSTSNMVDTTLASQKAVLEAALLQYQQQSQAAFRPALLATQIGGKQEANTWVRNSNKPEDAISCPESTLVRWPAYFKKANGIEKDAVSGIPGYCRLVNNKKHPKLS